MRIVELLIKTLRDYSVQLHGVIGGAWKPVPLTQLNTASNQLTTALDSLTEILDNPKSKIVTTV